MLVPLSRMMWETIKTGFSGVSRRFKRIKRPRHVTERITYLFEVPLIGQVEFELGINQNLFGESRYERIINQSIYNTFLEFSNIKQGLLNQIIELVDINQELYNIKNEDVEINQCLFGDGIEKIDFKQNLIIEKFEEKDIDIPVKGEESIIYSIKTKRDSKLIVKILKVL